MRYRQEKNRTASTIRAERPFRLVRIARWAAVPVAGFICAPVAAQTVLPPAVIDSNPAPVDQTGVPDIVVTAQRRSERLQDVPVTVTALSAQALTTSGITTPQELSFATPGLTVVYSRNAATPYIRGVGTQNSVLGDEGSVANYVDGVYIAALSGTLMTFNNVDRVEVLKGPQGTLFGRNTTGGLLQVITSVPDGETHVKGSVEYDSYNTPIANLYATTGLSSTVFLDTAAYYSHQGDGWGTQLPTGKDINKTSDQAVRSKLVWEPGDATRIILAGDWSHHNSDYGTIRQIYPGTKAIGGLPSTGSIYDSSAGLPSEGKADQYGGSLTIKQQLSFANLTSISAIRHYSSDYNFDQDGTPAQYANVYFAARTDSYQQELLLNGDVGRLKYTTGVFLYYQKDNLARPLTSTVLAQFNSGLNTEQKTYSAAGYLQATYALDDATNLTAGGRFTYSKRKISGYFTGLPGGLQPVGAIYTSKGPGSYGQSVSFDRATWHASLDHHFNKDIMVFVSASEGFKDGIFNMADPAQPVVRPEVLRSYEGGIKSSFLDRHLQVNVSGFHYDYKNIQLSVLHAGTTAIYNAAAGRVNGMELETIVRPPIPIGHLQVSASLSWLRAHYVDFANAPFTYLNPAVCTPGGATPGHSTGPSTGGGITCGGSAAGNDMVNAPHITLNASAEYRLPAAGGQLVFNVSYFNSDGYFFNPDNRVRQPGYELVNGRIAFEYKRWTAFVFAKNLAATKYFTQLSSTTFGDEVVAGAPRTYGGGVSFEF